MKNAVNASVLEISCDPSLSPSGSQPQGLRHSCLILDTLSVCPVFIRFASMQRQGLIQQAHVYFQNRSHIPLQSVHAGDVRI